MTCLIRPFLSFDLGRGFADITWMAALEARPEMMQRREITFIVTMCNANELISFKKVFKVQGDVRLSIILREKILYSET